MNLIAILHLPAFVAGRWEDGRIIPDSWLAALLRPSCRRHEFELLCLL